MNVCGDYPDSRQKLRSYSTNNLDTIAYRKPVPLRVSHTEYFEREQTHLKSETDAKFVAENEESHLRRPTMKRTISADQLRRRCLTISEQELKETEQKLKHAKSFCSLKSTTEQRAQKKYSFKRLFDKKKPCPVPAIQESSGQDSGLLVNTSKKIKPKPLRLRSLSSSCLSLAGKTRPKLINRLSCPDNLIPTDKNTTPNQDQTVSSRGTKPGDKTPTGESYTCTKTANARQSLRGTKPGDKTPTGESYTCTKTANARLRDSFKLRHSRELTKRDSQILVTRFEVELAITKNDRNKLVSFINSKSVNLNAKDYYGKTLLHTACSVGNYQCAQILINAGGKIDIQDQAGFTPLHCAVVANHVPCAAVMIAAGADVMTSTRTMHTALTLAHEEEMILLVGRSLLLRNTQKRAPKDDNTRFSLRETKL
jgi:hypothetical protein